MALSMYFMQNVHVPANGSTSAKATVPSSAKNVRSYSALAQYDEFSDATYAFSQIDNFVQNGTTVPGGTSIAVGDPFKKGGPALVTEVNAGYHAGNTWAVYVFICDVFF